MSLDSLKDRLPAYAKDIKLNLSNIAASTALNPQQAWGAMLAAALAARNETVTQAIATDAAQHLSPPAMEAAKAAAAIMAMNNIYYRSVHLLGDPEYRKLPARLRMTVIGNPGVDKLDFELWSLAVSAVNGCGMCLEAHAHEVTSKGASREAIQDALRIAAVIHAAVTVLEAEAAMPAIRQAA
ncbi:MAG: carboxymuconolactone decarboxylase family protein [Alphaproteobacteria bacterium]